MTPTLALLGAGAMGEALLAGVLAAGRTPDSVVVVEPYEVKAREIAAKYAVTVTDVAAAVAVADTVLVAVKPADVEVLLRTAAPHLRSGALVVSIAAGVTTAAMERALPAGTPVVRVMPNTPALVGKGMAAVSGGAYAGPAHIDEAVALLGAVGRVVVVPEKQQDAVTAISGSGPAYVFAVVDAMIEAGVHLGLTRPVASELVIQTFLGSATLLRETGTHPAVLREQVTSPGGTTAAGLRQLDERGVRAAFIAACEAARDRSRELGA